MANKIKMADKRKLVLIFTLTIIFMFIAFFQARAKETESGITGLPYGQIPTLYLNPEIDGSNHFDWVMKNRELGIRVDRDGGMIIPPYKFEQWPMHEDPPLQPIDPDQADFSPYGPIPPYGPYGPFGGDLLGEEGPEKTRAIIDLSHEVTKND